MGLQHVQNDVLTIDQGKTKGGEEAHLEIPVHPKLREIIDATPTVGVKTCLVTHFGFFGQVRWSIKTSRRTRFLAKSPTVMLSFNTHIAIDFHI